MSVAIPHFSAPFAFDPSGNVTVVDQDTPEEIAACVYNSVVCPIGYRTDAPTFGVHDVLFSTVPINTTSLISDAVKDEPRAQITATEAGDTLDASVRAILMSVTATVGRT